MESLFVRHKDGSLVKTRIPNSRCYECGMVHCWKKSSFSTGHINCCCEVVSTLSHRKMVPGSHLQAQEYCWHHFTGVECLAATTITMYIYTGYGNNLLWYTLFQSMVTWWNWKRKETGVEPQQYLSMVTVTKWA